MIDQTKLPNSLEFVTFTDFNQVADAIRNLVIRGAPAIGVSGAFGLALAALQSDASEKDKLIEYMINAEIIKIPYTEANDISTTEIPEWIKNTAGWWAVGAIDDTEFTLALQYLVKAGIITVNLSKA